MAAWVQIMSKQQKTVSKAALTRLRKEFKLIVSAPVQYIEAVPLESNILEWHYVITGPTESPYHGGEYHGKLIFPPAYPYSPPGIMMHTPNGRFKTNCRLCLSMSDFHPESWNPMWNVSTILQGLLSFMLEDEKTTGSIESTEAEKRALAARSKQFNRKDPVFRECFPQLCGDGDDGDESEREESSSSSLFSSLLGSSSSTSSSSSSLPSSPPQPESASPAAVESAFLNRRVRIHGTSREDMNGQCGVAIAYTADERCTVRLESNLRAVSLKLKHIELTRDGSRMLMTRVLR